ncbi:hypothetical protein AB1Y20_015205 [Prymnesium parvum]|uniref:PWWP domain-containing protein n=1 Tax=Prymnesium parvum TaxID=97485 RepID=A0AB34K0P6_PRYPA
MSQSSTSTSATTAYHEARDGKRAAPGPLYDDHVLWARVPGTEWWPATATIMENGKLKKGEVFHVTFIGLDQAGFIQYTHAQARPFEGTHLVTKKRPCTMYSKKFTMEEYDRAFAVACSYNVARWWGGDPDLLQGAPPGSPWDPMQPKAKATAYAIGTVIKGLDGTEFIVTEDPTAGKLVRGKRIGGTSKRCWKRVFEPVRVKSEVDPEPKSRSKRAVTPPARGNKLNMPKTSRVAKKPRKGNTSTPAEGAALDAEAKPSPPPKAGEKCEQKFCIEKGTACDLMPRRAKFCPTCGASQV